MNINFSNVSGGYIKTEKISNAGIKGYTNIMKGTGVTTAAQHDKVSISPEATSFREVDRTAKSIASEVSGSASQEKINSLKAQIQAGTYNVSAGNVASAILDRLAF